MHLHLTDLTEVEIGTTDVAGATIEMTVGMIEILGDVDMIDLGECVWIENYMLLELYYSLFVLGRMSRSKLAHVVLVCEPSCREHLKRNKLLCCKTQTSQVHKSSWVVRVGYRSQADVFSAQSHRSASSKLL